MASILSHNHNQKSMLAKLLATENITIQHSASAKTAWFDVKRRILNLPMWKEMSNDLYDMLVIHEVGHALDTPGDAWVSAVSSVALAVFGKVTPRHQSVAKDFLNVTEDVRIDKRQKRRYPGSRRNYLIGYNELIDNDFFGTAGKDINKMMFIDRMNIYFKGGVGLGITFSKEEQVFIDRANLLETWEDVLSLATDILTYAKDELDAPQTNRSFDFSDDEEESDEDGESESFEFSDDDDSEDYEDEEGESENSKGHKGDAEDGDPKDDENKEGEAKGEGDDDEKSKSESDAKSGEDSDSEGEGSDPSDEDDDEDGKDNLVISSGRGASPAKNQKEENDRQERLPESNTEKAWAQRQQHLLDNAAIEYKYLTLPRPILSKIVDDYKVVHSQLSSHFSKNSEHWNAANFKNVNDWKTSEAQTISFMVKEFEMRRQAVAYSKSATAKTGLLNTNKIHSYQYNDDVFRRNTVVPTGKNHGFVMFVDWSGSMADHIASTMKQMFSLTMFCRRIQVPFEVYLFRDRVYSNDELGKDTGAWEQNTENDVMLTDVKLRNVLSSRMNAMEYTKALSNLWALSKNPHTPSDSMTGTPLNSAIVAAIDVVNQFRAKSKVEVLNVVFLTDGESDRMGYKKNYGKDTVYILQDDKTKKSYNLNAKRVGQSTFYDDGMYSTSVLYKMLKDRTGANLVGFYLVASKIKNVIQQFVPNASYEVTNKMSQSWAKSGYCTLVNQGFDEYYLMNPRFFKIDDRSLDTSVEKNAKKILSEFKKFSANKKENRVLLRQFITKISKEAA
jgi:hypothetical protein